MRLEFKDAVAEGLLSFLTAALQAARRALAAFSSGRTFWIVPTLEDAMVAMLVVLYQLPVLEMGSGDLNTCAVRRCEAL